MFWHPSVSFSCVQCRVSVLSEMVVVIQQVGWAMVWYGRDLVKVEPHSSLLLHHMTLSQTLFSSWWNNTIPCARSSSPACLMAAPCATHPSSWDRLARCTSLSINTYLWLLLLRLLRLLLLLHAANWWCSVLVLPISLLPLLQELCYSATKRKLRYYRTTAYGRCTPYYL